MRSVLLLFLSASMMAGCSSLLPNRAERSYPRSARVVAANGQVLYRMCHRDRRSLTVTPAAVRAHRRHGDTFGRCRSDRRRANRNRNRNRGRGRGRN